MKKVALLLIFVWVALGIGLVSCVDHSESERNSRIDDDATIVDDDAAIDDDTADDDLVDDDVTDDEPATDDDTSVPDGKLCPPGFLFFPAGTYPIKRAGNHWDPQCRGCRDPVEWQRLIDNMECQYTEYVYEIHLDAFCLAQYEASQPTATAENWGIFQFGWEVSPAQVRPDVLPWGNVSAAAAHIAVRQQGWRLPTYEEIHVAAICEFDESRQLIGCDTEKAWMWGSEWECTQSELSWFDTCEGPRPSDVGICGGPEGTSDYGSGIYDITGNFSEWLSQLWFSRCYETERIALFGGCYHLSHEDMNGHSMDPDRPGCFKMSSYGGYNYGIHEHSWSEFTAPNDDGFRPAADCGPRWRDWEPQWESTRVEFPLTIWYYAFEDEGEYIIGDKVEYQVEEPWWYQAPEL